MSSRIWLFQVRCDHSIIWFELSFNSFVFFRFRSLIALLFHHIEIGQRVSGGGSGYIGADRDLGLKATGLYFILLAIPGSSAFNIFHPMLYSKALSIFKLANKLHEVSNWLQNLDWLKGIGNKSWLAMWWIILLIRNYSDFAISLTHSMNWSWANGMANDKTEAGIIPLYSQSMSQ